MEQQFQTLIDRLNTQINTAATTNGILFQTLIDRPNTKKSGRSFPMKFIFQTLIDRLNTRKRKREEDNEDNENFKPL